MHIPAQPLDAQRRQAGDNARAAEADQRRREDLWANSPLNPANRKHSASTSTSTSSARNTHPGTSTSRPRSTYPGTGPNTPRSTHTGASPNSPRSTHTATSTGRPSSTSSVSTRHPRASALPQIPPPAPPYEQWHATATHALRDYRNLHTFPCPPAAQPPCRQPTCIAKASTRALALCACDVQKAFRALHAVVDVKEERTRWHPDRFAMCREDRRARFQAMAKEVFQVVDALYVAEREKGRLVGEERKGVGKKEGEGSNVRDVWRES